MRSWHWNERLILLAFACYAAPVEAQQAPPAPSLAELDFMSGCWRGEFGTDGVIEEFYSTPSDNLMLGASRFLRGSRAVQYEFTRITADSTGIVLLPFPGGKASEHPFELTVLTSNQAVFEAPEHDFPRRIIYSRNPDGSNTARIDAGAGTSQAQEWRMEPVRCGD